MYVFYSSVQMYKKNPTPQGVGLELEKIWRKYLLAMFFRGGFCKARRACGKIALKKMSLRSEAKRSGAFQKRSGAKRSDKPTPRGGRSEAERSGGRRRAERSEARPERSEAERGKRRGEALLVTLHNWDYV